MAPKTERKKNVKLK